MLKDKNHRMKNISIENQELLLNHKMEKESNKRIHLEKQRNMVSRKL